MITGLSPDGGIIRTAGKRTLLLQVVALVLAGILVMMFWDLSRRYRLLEDGIRENALWSVFQLDREARTLGFELSQVVEHQQLDKAALKNLSLRYNILYSRIKIIQESQFEASFAQDSEMRRTVRAVQDEVLGYTDLFDRIDAGYRPSRAELIALQNNLSVLVSDVSEFLMRANNQLSTARAENRDMIIRLEGTTALFVLLLLGSVVYLIVSLRRQLVSVREASRNFELMAEEISEAYKAADAGNRAKSQFMATMGHEIRTPLNAILGTAELLELSDLPDDSAALVKTIHSSGEALLEIINEILDFSKIENGMLELEVRSVNIRTLAESTLEIVRGRAEEHGNRISLDIPDLLSVPQVRTDPTRLRQILLNLLSNAVKFTRDGVVTLRLREFIRDDTLFLRFEVQDTGIGIDEAGLAKLFQPFTQVDASISRRYGGTGLGLTICKQIVDRLEGQLGVQSALGEGSLFWLEIPTKMAEFEPEPVVTKAGQDPAIKLPRGRILLVEDNKVNQQVAVRFLDRLGQHVTIASNGIEAVAAARSQVFDLILMDMQMPEMDGIEATLRIRAEVENSPPIIAMTANASDDDRRRCEEAGMTAFESKPITLKRLQSVLATFLADKGLPESTSEEQTAKPQPEPQVEPLDAKRRNELVEVLGEEVFDELIETFFEDTVEILESLQKALAGSDPVLADRALHSLKGAAVNVGLNDIAALAESLRQDMPTPAALATLNMKINAHKRLLAA